MMNRRVVPLAEAAEVIRGVSYDASEAVFDAVPSYSPILRAGNIQSELNITDDLVWVPSSRVSKQQRIRQNDIIMCTSSGSADIVGKSARALADWDGSFGAFCVGIRAKQEVDPSFLFHFLNSKSFKNWAQRSLGANIKNIRKSELEGFYIPLPELKEQKRIAAILDKADAIRRKRQQAIRLADEFLRSVFLDMFGDPIANPKGWPVCKMGDLAPNRGEIVDGPFGSSLKPEHYVPEGIRVVRNFNIRRGEFDCSEFKYVTAEKFEEVRRSEVQTNDLLISTKGTVGNVCLMPVLEGPSILSASGTVRVRISSLEAITEFVMWQMLMPSYQAYILTNQAGAVQKYLNLAGIRQLNLIIPDVNLQIDFLGIVSRIKAIKSSLLKAFDNDRDLFLSLSQKAFHGEL